MLTYRNGIEFTGFVANAAFDTFFLIDRMEFFLLTGNRILWAFTAADLATGAGFLFDFVVKQRLAHAGWAFLLPDVLVVLIAEVENRR
jgi:hypothetical protein